MSMGWKGTYVAIVDIGVGLTGTCVWAISLRITEFLLFQVARNLYQCTLIESVKLSST